MPTQRNGATFANGFRAQPPRLCSVAGCGRGSVRKGMCDLHFQRFKRHGDPLTTRNRAAGTGSMRTDGYCMHEIDGRSVLEHVLVAERALGKRLPPGAQVHHVDGNRANNAPSNLVICPSSAYHQLLHVRTDAMTACGNPNWRKCHICKQYDGPANLRFYEPSGLIRHIECWRRRYREQKEVSNDHHVS